jgi:hypothetical protein
MYNLWYFSPLKQKLKLKLLNIKSLGTFDVIRRSWGCGCVHKIDLAIDSSATS